MYVLLIKSQTNHPMQKYIYLSMDLLDPIQTINSTLQFHLSQDNSSISNIRMHKINKKIMLDLGKLK